MMATPKPHAESAERYDVLSAVTYTKKNDGGSATAWNRVGVAFAHKDGEGLNVTLTSLPLDGKLVIRKHVNREDASPTG
jgi:hypothetical protein